ncbi:uncharacterized protein LOC123319983 [Coccinella septempunctata]|uniref:uncharacterized protein LOC123319983 n=1 Tax=Coccinella septempunctata TaxID=41139 RepID=UPI001D05DF15|nr:uncharacterized protein LOC123319983 [Coccinella septempunctata]
MQSTSLKPLNIDQVNKKILQRKPFVRPDYDLLNPTGNYHDEHLKMYKEKCARFADIAKKYREFNEQTFLTSKEKLLKDYENFIEGVSEDFFHLKQKETESEIKEDFYEKMRNYEVDGRRERRRLIRNIHEKLDTTTNDYCIEPWFKRYLILNKFIYYARAVVLKNRLLKNLEILKQLNHEKIQELEQKHLRCRNESYSQLFAKFL